MSLPPPHFRMHSHNRVSASEIMKGDRLHGGGVGTD